MAKQQSKAEPVATPAPTKGADPGEATKYVAPEVQQWNDDDTVSTGVDDAGNVFANSEKHASVRAMLDEPDPDAPKVETEEAKTEGDAEEPVVEAPKPSRRDVLKAIDTESRLRKAEAALAQERDKREIAERAIKEGSISALIRAKGLTREQAVEQLVTANDDEPPPPAKPERNELQERLDALEAREKAAQTSEALRITAVTIADMDTPIIKSAKRIAVPTGQGNAATYMTPHELVMRTAEQMWNDAGRPQGDGVRLEYLKLAATNVEEALTEEYSHLIQKAPAPRVTEATPAKKVVPPVGKRGSPSPAPNADAFAGMDEDERRREIRRQHGF